MVGERHASGVSGELGEYSRWRPRVAGRSDEPLLPMPVLGEIQVRGPDQRPNELGLTRRRQAEPGGLVRLVLEKPGFPKMLMTAEARSRNAWFRKFPNNAETVRKCSRNSVRTTAILRRTAP